MAKKAKPAAKSTEPKSGSSKAGRPSTFDDRLVLIAMRLAESGKTDEEIAKTLDVTARTLYRWKNYFPELSQALKTGKLKADDMVVESLFQNAVTGNVTAQIFWLKNRQPAEWRDKQDHELSGKDGAPLQGPQIVVTLPTNSKEAQ